MQCRQDPTYGQVPDPQNANDLKAKADRIAYLQKWILTYEGMAASTYWKEDNKGKYLAFKEELELLLQQTKSAGPPEPPETLPPYTPPPPDLLTWLKRLINKNPIPTIAAAAIGTLILKRLLK